MSLIIQCTGGHKMSVSEDYLGKRVRCPKCQEVVTVEAPTSLPAPPPPIPAQMERYVQAPGAAPARDHERGYDDMPQERPRTRAWDDRDRDYDRRDERAYGRDDDHDRLDDRLDAEEIAQMQTVSLGLIFVGWRYLLWIFALLLFIGMLSMLFFVEEVARIPRPRAAPWIIMAVILGIIAFLLALVQLVFTFIGSGMCCRAPRRSGAKGLIASALICDGVFVLSGLLVFLLAILAEAARRGGGEAFAVLAVGVGIIGVLCFIAAHLLIHLFLRRMSQFVHDPRNASSALTTMILWLVIFVGGIAIAFVLGFIMGISRVRGETVAMVMLGFAWINTLLLILAYGLLIGVISRLRRRIASEIQGSM